MCNIKEDEGDVYQTADIIKNTGLVHDKIDQAKEYFTGITKSGRNNYQKYNYLELSDIRPVVMRVCEDLKLRTRITWNHDEMILCITDKEDGSSEYFQLPVPHINIEDPDKYMKAVGKVQTYSMRYLYIQAFEIAVPDRIDKGERNMKSKSYINGKKLESTPGNAEPVDQTTLNTNSKSNERDIIDLARTISEEMADKGIETTDKNIYEYTKQKWLDKKISPNEFRQLKARLQSGEKV